MYRLKRLIIITGANKGLGKAFYDRFISEKNEDIIISISRIISEDQQQLIDKKSSKFVFIPIDLGQIQDTSGLKQLVNFQNEVKEIIYINNAGVIDPIGKVGDIATKELVNSINVNILAPAIIINYVFELFKGKKITIINISSGATDHVIEGWGAYCSGKAFMKMFVNVLGEQEKDSSLIEVYNIAPGLIDTEMQRKIRNTNVDGFTRHNEFVLFKEEGKLQSANEVANKILLETNISP